MITGKVAATLTPVDYVINRGDEHGVVIGLYFGVPSGKSVRIVDPGNGEHLGDLREFKNTVMVVEVREKFCVARQCKLAEFPAVPFASVAVGDDVVQI